MERNLHNGTFTCTSVNPVFVRPVATDILTPGSRVSLLWVLGYDYSNNFSLTLDLKSLRGSFNERILSDVFVPDYPSTVHVFGTDVTYDKPATTCGYRVVRVNYTMPTTDIIQSDPNYLITAYSHGSNFSDVFNSDAFQIRSDNASDIQTPDGAGKSGRGLTTGQSVAIAVVVSVSFMLLVFGLLFRFKRRRQPSDNRIGNSDGIAGNAAVHTASTQHEISSSEVFEVQSPNFGFPIFELPSPITPKHEDEDASHISRYPSWEMAHPQNDRAKES